MALKPLLKTFDLLSAAEELLASCGIDPRWVHGEASAAQVEATVREITAPLAAVSPDGQGVLLRTFCAGYLAGIVRTARTTDEWRSKILTAIERAHEAGSIDADLYQALVASCTHPEKGFALPESAWPVH